MEIEKRIERKRNQFRETYSSALFNSYLNASLVVVILGFSLIYSATQLTWDISSLLLIPLGFLFAEAAMYITHRWQQHRKIKFSERIFELHSIWHHGMFSNNQMHVDSFKDMNMVVLPFFIHGLVIYLFYFPLALVLSLLFQSDLGWVLMFSVALQLSWYEIVHTAAHLKSPPKLFKRLAAHHRAHHNPNLMGRNNFGIGTTLFDKLFRTAHQ